MLPPAQREAAAGREVQWLLLLCSLQSLLPSPLFLLLLLHPHLSPHFHRIRYSADGLLFPVRAGGILIKKPHTSSRKWSSVKTHLQTPPPHPSSSFPLSDTLFLESPMLFACTHTDTCPDKPPTQSPPGMLPGLCPRRRSTSRCPGGPALQPGFFPSDAWQSVRGQGH